MAMVARLPFLASHLDGSADCSLGLGQSVDLALPAIHLRNVDRQRTMDGVIRSRALMVGLPLILVCGVSVVSCGDPSTTPTGPFPTTGPTVQQFPATSLMGRLPADGAEPTVMPVYVDEAVRCPDITAPLAGSDGDGIAEATRLEPMLGQVLAYGGQHRDQFGTYGLVWHSGGDASVLISLTANLDAHRSALAGQVPYPDELIVCQAALSGDANLALQALLVDELAGRFVSIGQGFGAVAIVLPAAEAQLATDLTARYGDIVSITFGEVAAALL
jgi:hypothetical protein